MATTEEAERACQALNRTKIDHQLILVFTSGSSYTKQQFQTEALPFASKSPRICVGLARHLKSRQCIGKLLSSTAAGWIFCIRALTSVGC